MKTQGREADPRAPAWTRRQRTAGIFVTAAVLAILAVAVGWPLAHGWNRGGGAGASNPAATVSNDQGGAIIIDDSPTLQPNQTYGSGKLDVASPSQVSRGIAVVCTWNSKVRVARVHAWKVDAAGVGSLNIEVTMGPTTPSTSHSLTITLGDQTPYARGSGTGLNPNGTEGKIAFGDGAGPGPVGSFAWTCGEPPEGLASPAASPLPYEGPDSDAQGVPVLAIFVNGKEVGQGLVGCPAQVTTPSTVHTTDCGTTDFWVTPLANGKLVVVKPGDDLEFGLHGWTPVSADVIALSVTSARALSKGGNPEDYPAVGLHPVSDAQAIRLTVPDSLDWVVKAEIQGARDDGSTMDVVYTFLLSVK